MADNWNTRTKPASEDTVLTKEDGDLLLLETGGSIIVVYGEDWTSRNKPGTDNWSTRNKPT